MRVNQHTAISTSRALLVPYEAHHVPKYHAWMQDPAIQEATASEPLSLEEEYENQQSWRSAGDKLTFIVCAPLETSGDEPVAVKQLDTDDQMRGDVNFFLHPCDEDEQEDGEVCLMGEVDIMIAEPQHQNKGLGSAAVCALLMYLQRHMDDILLEYAAGGQLARLKLLMAKIKEGNVRSRALFAKLGFRQEGEVNYFGEVRMVMSWGENTAGLWETEVKDYRESLYGGVVDVGRG